MKQIQYILFLMPIIVLGQQTLKGKVVNSDDVEGIHVFNKTYQKYTITDHEGVFEIMVREKDTLVFSAIQYGLKTIVMSNEILKKDSFLVFLEAKVNELDEVYIKPKLSGDLLADSKSIKTRKIVTSKTLGLPNSHVIPPTQEERKLYTATHTGAGIIPVETIINAISGRTKMLKNHVKLNRKAALENKVLTTFGKNILKDFEIPQEKLHDFLFYLSSDELFTHIIRTKNNMIILDFINTKSKTYIKLLDVKG